MQATGIRLEQDALLLLTDDECQELYKIGELRLAFPRSVLRFALVGNIILCVLFEM
jgi:hypothetical protein